MTAYPDDVRQYVNDLFTPSRAAHEVRSRADYLALLKLPRIADAAQHHTVRAEVEPGGEDMGTYTRYRGWVETEPHVRVKFWMLVPNGDGPFPLAVTPHGHENGDTYVGIATDPITQNQIDQKDQAVAVAAAEHGFLTIAPATRGIGVNPSAFTIPDIAKIHDGRDCRCHNWHVLAAGRTMMGERVWDLMRLFDWALTLPNVKSDTLLLTGNSGGGMATIHTAAADERVTMAVGCCAFTNYVSPQGVLRHCPCNLIPGMLDFGEYWDVASLIAPRKLLTVNGKADPAHPVAEVQHAADQLKSHFTAAGCADHYDHRFGDGGHRFFHDVMWPWIEQAMAT